MKTIRQTAHRPRDRRGIVGLKQQRFGIRLWSGAAVLLFIERVGRRLKAVAAPAITGVANDSEEPDTPIRAVECSEVSKGSQGRLLHDVFRVVFIPHQPARQPIGGAEMRKDDRVKAFAKRRRRCRAGESISYALERGSITMSPVWKLCERRTPTIVVQHRCQDARTGGGR